MNRTSFLRASAALALTGCGGHALQAVQAIPAAVAGGSAGAASKTRKTNVRYVPAKADPIPARVLKNPLIGEARRFDGATPPSASWMLMQGQTLEISAYPALFAVLGTSAGGDGKTTFTLPAPPVGFVVAIAGARAVKPSSFADASRSSTPEESLGDGAVTPPLKPRAPATISSEQQLTLSTVHASSRPPAPVPSDAVARYATARAGIASSGRDRLSASTRAHLDDAVAAAVDGRTDVAGAVRTLASVLSPTEALAVLHVNDTAIRAINPEWQGTSTGADPRFGAANVLVANAITREAAHAIAARESNASP